MYGFYDEWDDTPVYRALKLDETPMYRELTEAEASSRRLAGSLVDAVYADHDEKHEGPIMFCDASACQTAFESVHKVA